MKQQILAQVIKTNASRWLRAQTENTAFCDLFLVKPLARLYLIILENYFEIFQKISYDKSD